MSAGVHDRPSASTVRLPSSSACRVISRDTADITGVCQKIWGSCTYDLNCFGLELLCST